MTSPRTTRYLTAEWLLPITSPPVKDGYLAVENGRITAIGRLEGLPESLEILSPKPGSILTPGLVNTHTHLEQTWPEVIARNPGEPFSEWLLAVVARNRQFSSLEEKATRCAAGAEELLRTGTTCVNDIASGPEALQILDQKGLRGIVSCECFHPDNENIDISKLVNAFQRFRAGFESHPRLKAGLSPHSPYNVSPAAWKKLVEACQPPLVHTHLAEFEDEVRYLCGETSSIPEVHLRILGRTYHPTGLADSPTAYMANHHLLNDHTVLAHATHTSHSDRKLIAESGAMVAHCPRSNQALHGKTLALADWQGLDVPVGLGTDGRLSTEDLDLRAEARVAMSLQGLDAKQVLELLTVQGARVMGLQDEIGTLTPGKWADVVLWQTDPQAAGSPEEAVLAESTQAIQALVAGNLCWQEGG